MIKIPLDKELHLKAGLFISFVAIVFVEAIGLHWMWTVSAVAVAAIGKEVHDLLSYGKFDYKDIIYTIVGGLPGIALSIWT